MGGHANGGKATPMGAGGGGALMGVGNAMPMGMWEATLMARGGGRPR